MAFFKKTPQNAELYKAKTGDIINPSLEIAHFIDLCNINLDNFDDAEFIYFVYEFIDQKKRVELLLNEVCNTKQYYCIDEFCKKKYFKKWGCVAKKIQNIDLIKDKYLSKKKYIKERCKIYINIFNNLCNII